MFFLSRNYTNLNSIVTVSFNCFDLCYNSRVNFDYRNRNAKTLLIVNFLRSFVYRRSQGPACIGKLSYFLF